MVRSVLIGCAVLSAVHGPEVEEPCSAPSLYYLTVTAYCVVSLWRQRVTTFDLLATNTKTRSTAFDGRDFAWGAPVHAIWHIIVRRFCTLVSWHV